MPYLSRSIRNILDIPSGHVIQLLNYLNKPSLPLISPFTSPIGSIPPPSLSPGLPKPTKLKALEAHAKELIPIGLVLKNEAELELFLGHLEYIYKEKLKKRKFTGYYGIHWYEWAKAKQENWAFNVKLVWSERGYEVKEMGYKHNHEMQVEVGLGEGIAQKKVEEVVRRKFKEYKPREQRDEEGKWVLDWIEKGWEYKWKDRTHKVSNEILSLWKKTLSEEMSVKKEETKENIENKENIMINFEMKKEESIWKSEETEQVKFDNYNDYIQQYFDWKVLISQINPTIKATLCFPKCKPKIHDGPVIINTSISKTLDSQWVYMILFFQVDKWNNLWIPWIVFTQTFWSDLLHQMFMTFSQVYTMPKTFICDTNPSVVSILQIIKSLHSSLKVIISQYYFFMHLRTSSSTQSIEVQQGLSDLIQFIQNFIASPDWVEKFNEWSKDLLLKYNKVFISQIEPNFLFNLIISNVHMCIQQSYKDTYLLQSFEHSFAIKQLDLIVSEIKKLGDSVQGLDKIINKFRNVGSIEQNLNQILLVPEFAKWIIDLELESTDKFTKDEVYFIRYITSFYNEFILKELFWRYQISLTCEIKNQTENEVLIINTSNSSDSEWTNEKIFSIDKSNLKWSWNIYFSVGVIWEHIFVYLLRWLNLSLEEIWVNNYLANNVLKLNNDESKFSEIVDLFKTKYSI